MSPKLTFSTEGRKIIQTVSNASGNTQNEIALCPSADTARRISKVLNFYAILKELSEGF